MNLKNYLEQRKLKKELKKTEKNIQKHQNELHISMEYLSVLQKELNTINYKKRTKDRRQKKK